MIKRILLFCMLGTTLCYAREYLYLEVTGTDSTYRTWQVETYERGYKVSVDDPRCFQIYILDSCFQTLAWERNNKDEATVIKGELKDHQMILKGTFQNNMYEAAYPTGNYPWFQKYAFSLKGFIASPEKKKEFVVLRYANLEPFTLQIVKEKDETIAMNHVDVLCCRAKLSVTGWKSRFYSVKFWFRKSDGLFVRFEGVNGPPGTPTTTIELIEEREGLFGSIQSM